MKDRFAKNEMRDTREKSIGKIAEQRRRHVQRYQVQNAQSGRPQRRSQTHDQRWMNRNYRPRQQYHRGQNLQRQAQRYRDYVNHPASSYRQTIASVRQQHRRWAQAPRYKVPQKIIPGAAIGVPQISPESKRGGSGQRNSSRRWQKSRDYDVPWKCTCCGGTNLFGAACTICQKPRTERQQPQGATLVGADDIAAYEERVKYLDQEDSKAEAESTREHVKRSADGVAEGGSLASRARGAGGGGAGRGGGGGGGGGAATSSPSASLGNKTRPDFSCNDNVATVKEKEKDEAGRRPYFLKRKAPQIAQL